MLRTSKVERLDLYKDHDTQILLSKFLSGEIKELEPIFDPKLGYCYPAVEAIVGDQPRADVFLNKLYEADILERKLYDKIIYCPKCNGPNISVRYCCPYCKSYDIKKSSLIEHVKCGYMDVEENFHKGNKLTCPKCHEELKKPDVDYRRAGIWCTCKDCSKSFDIPIAKQFCRNCRQDFTFEDIIIKNVYSYTLKEAAREEAALGQVLIAPIREFLMETGLKVEGSTFLKGKSGANHLFDIVARDNQERPRVTVIDVATTTENVVSEQPVIALFAKIFDVSPDNAYLIAIPKVSENGKRMAESYKIRIIEAKNQKEATRALKEKMLENQ